MTCDTFHVRARARGSRHLTNNPVRDRNAQSIDALLLTALVVAPGLASAQATATHPDYSGTYVLDPAPSVGERLPQKMTLEITQTPAGLTLDRPQTMQMGRSSRTSWCW